MNGWARTVGTMISCLMLLAVATRAAGSVRGEVDKQTLDALLTSPMTNKTILMAKWAGSVLSVRLACVWLGLVWIVACAFGGLSPLAIPCLVVAWFIYAGTFAAVGLWFSVECRTSLRATVWTLLTTVLIGGGHWIFCGMCCMPFWGRSSDAEIPLKFLLGQTPPAVLVILGFEMNDDLLDRKGELMFFSVLGLVCWTGLLLGLLSMVRGRFAERTGREAVLVFNRPAPRQPRET
jgi:ABC-type Na+ efflux pump permease subunit